MQKRAAKGSYARADKDAGGIDAGLSERDLMGSGGASEYQAMYARTRTTPFPLLSAAGSLWQKLQGPPRLIHQVTHSQLRYCCSLYCRLRRIAKRQNQQASKDNERAAKLSEVSEAWDQCSGELPGAAVAHAASFSHTSTLCVAVALCACMCLVCSINSRRRRR